MAAARAADARLARGRPQILGSGTEPLWLRRGGGQVLLFTACLQQYPEAPYFYNWAEEFELIQTLRAQLVPVVGLDSRGLL